MDFGDKFYGKKKKKKKKRERQIESTRFREKTREGLKCFASSAIQM